MKKTFHLFSLLALAFLYSCGSNSDSPVKNDLSISLDKTQLTLEAGSITRIIAYFNPSDAENTAHEWRSSQPDIATVDASGLVKGVNPGKAIITAVALANGKTASCAVEVVDKIIPPTGVLLNSKSEYLLIGDKVKLEATITPANSNAKSLTWTSSNQDVASVDSEGIVSGISEGIAEISVTTSNNKTAKCTVTVGDRTVEFSDIKINVIDDTSAGLSFKATARGVDITELGVCYDTEKTPTTESISFKVEIRESVTGTMKNLKPNTSYFLRIYAKSGDKIYYSPTRQFSTHGTIKTVFRVSQIYKDKLIFHTPIIPGVDLKVCYGIAPHPEITDNLAQVTKYSDYYTVTLPNLGKATQYYLRAYTVTNGQIKYYDDESSASTLGIAGQNITGRYSFRFISNDSFCCLKVNTDLPEGTYCVHYNGDGNNLGGGLSNSAPTPTESPKRDKVIYISGGKQTFYSINTYRYGNWQPYGICKIWIENLETGVEYFYDEELR